MADDQTGDKKIETHAGSTGPPQRVDRSAVRRRSESPNLLTEEELAERQEKLRDKRRTVPLPDAPATRRRRGPAADAPPPDVPESDCEEPPS
jgi:hypothetical protein